MPASHGAFNMGSPDGYDIAAENMAASRSRIVDADYAVETAKLAQQQILQDAGTAMLAQAHSVVAEQALALLKDV